MELLIDTNVLLDVVFGRNGYEFVRQMFETIVEKKHKAYITATSVTDLFYIIHKETHDTAQTYIIMENIFRLVAVLTVSSGDVLQAFQKKWKDFEDCVQITAAENNELAGIITNNKKDFSKSLISVWSPEEYIQEFGIN